MIQRLYQGHSPLFDVREGGREGGRDGADLTMKEKETTEAMNRTRNTKITLKSLCGKIFPNCKRKNNSTQINWCFAQTQACPADTLCINLI